MATEDEKIYNGKAYDENMNWNKPMILYDEFGSVIFDPSDPETKEETNIKDVSDPGKENYKYETTKEGLDAKGN